jgi:hypothetical protein
MSPQLSGPSAFIIMILQSDFVIFRRHVTVTPTFPLRPASQKASFGAALSGGVMVAQESLELFVMVRIHAGQPFSVPTQPRRA